MPFCESKEMKIFVNQKKWKKVYKFRGRGYNMSNGKWHMVFATGRDDYAAGYAGFDGTIYSGN